MTKKDKVTVDDIIGIVKCEQTDSVEEVKKLRGRNERFIVDTAGTLVDMVTRDTFDYVSDVVGLLNGYDKENEQLKKELEENKELIQFKEQVFNLINKKLEENEKELNGVDTAMYYANKGTLNELKKELKE